MFQSRVMDNSIHTLKCSLKVTNHSNVTVFKDSVNGLNKNIRTEF